MRLSLLLIFLSAAPTLADPATDAEFFEKQVRPLLLAKCVDCHGPRKQKGGLRLDSRPAMLKGGDTGTAVAPGDPAASLMVKAIRYDDELKMPPAGKLTNDEIATLTAWVKGGATWPGDGLLGGHTPVEKAKVFDLAARAKAHWSFRPIQTPAVPAGGQGIDAFIRARLRAAKLDFAPAADRRTLIRRITFDLIGLPPTPEEIDAFEKDDAPNAYEKVVERLLASPHYGERWGRHWLDLVRYAETRGHEFDVEIPEAWRYRDYVIRAFNDDLPYDRFLHEHIAGDLLPHPRRHPTQGWNESALATGFWYLHEAVHAPVDARADQAVRIDNQIDVFGKTVFGLTIACARCHDHKFDPISTKDYYSLFGVISSSRYQQAFIEDPAPTVRVLEELKDARAKLALLLSPPLSRGGLGGVGFGSAKATPPTPPLKGGEKDRTEDWRSTSSPFDTFDARWRERWFATGLGLRPEADGGQGYPHTARESEKLGATLQSPTFVIDRRYLAVRVAGQDARVRVVLNGYELIRSPIYGGLEFKIASGPTLGWITFDLTMWKGQAAYLEFLDGGPGYFAVTEVRVADQPPPKVSSGTVLAPPSTELPEDADAKGLVKRIRELEARLHTPLHAPGMIDGTGRNEHVFIRGNHKTLGEEVPRRNLEAFGAAPFSSSGSGRLELARAVTDRANPLVARVMVNRLWKHHFGQGIVRSPDDFGLQGQPPTHPDLLDFLAVEFREHGWSLKHMHRLMVLSRTYQQASRVGSKPSDIVLAVDPQNKLLHRQNVRRLEAETIRDALLAVSGRLDRTMEGPGVLPHLTEHEGGRGKPASGPLDGNGRRSIYLQVRRNFLNPMFVAFDYPTPFTTIGRRSVSNVPAQALAMLNNPFVLQQADLWATRESEAFSSPPLSKGGLGGVGFGPAKATPPTPPFKGGEKDTARVRSMYRTAFGREPTQAEIEAAVAFLTEQGQESRAWADLAHVLLNTKEFIFVE